MDTPERPTPEGGNPSEPADQGMAESIPAMSEQPAMAEAAPAMAEPTPPPQMPSPPPPSAPPTSGYNPAPPIAWEAPPDEAGPAPGYAFGGPGERLVAYILDTIIISIGVIVSIIVGLIVTAIVPALGIPLLIIAVLVISVGYFPYFWVKGGQTLGMRRFNLYVVRDKDGGPIGAGAAILRLIGYWIDGLVLYLGFIWILIDKRKRGWHDLIAGTVVVKKS